jgi:hypothetical protein
MDKIKHTYVTLTFDYPVTDEEVMQIKITSPAHVKFSMSASSFRRARAGYPQDRQNPARECVYECAMYR